MSQDPRNRKTILYFNLYTGMGGGEYSLFYLLKYLDRTKYRPIMMFNKRGPFVEKVEALGVKTVIIPYDVVILRRFFHPRALRKNLEAARQIHRFLRQEKVNVVQCSDVFGLLLLSRSLVSLRIPVVYSVIMFYEWLRVLLFNLLALLFVKRIATTSTALRDDLARRTLFLRRKMVVVHPGVDTSVFYSRSPESKEQTRQRLGLPLGKKVVGLVGRYEVGKGHLAFIESAKDVLKSRDDVLFVMVGGAMTEAIVPAVSRYRQKVLKKADELVAAGNLLIWDHRDDIPEILSCFDVFVCASDYEGFGLTVLEAVASGVPAVVSDKVGALEVLNGCGGVFRARSRNRRSFVEEILKAIGNGDKQHVSRMGPPQNISQRWSWAECAKQFEGMYDLLIRNPLNPE